MSIKLLYSCFVSFFDLYKEYNNCLISFLSFSELFNWAKVIGRLLSIWFGVGIFKPCPEWYYLLNSINVWTIFNIFTAFLFIYFFFLSFSDIALILFFKSINPLSITFTNLSLSFLFFISYNFFVKTVAATKLKRSSNKL